MIGIGGIGVSAVARGLLGLGYEVTGSDVRASQITRALEAEGATVHIGHDAAYVDGVDLVVYSTAIPETNPELVAARRQAQLGGGAKLAHRAEVLGAILAAHKRSVGVVGTHGKGTVSSALTRILEAAGWNPAFLIGGLLEDFGKVNARITDRGYVVAEVDESDGSLRHVHPLLVVVNNLEADHLNYYDDLAHVQDTVVEALNANHMLAGVVVNVDDPGARAIIERLHAPVTTFGRSEDADVRAVDVEQGALESDFVLARGGLRLGSVHLPLPGLYNVDNATAAAAAALSLEVPAEAICAGLSDFHGLENRFTVVEAGGRRIIKDYISHPTGIRRVLAAAKQAGGPITAVFKPYRFTMIHYLQDDYAEAFHDADETVITELYTAGEVPIPGIDTEFLCDKIRARGPRVTYIQGMDDIVPHLHAHTRPGDQILFFGGDDLFQLADRFVAELAQ